MLSRLPIQLRLSLGFVLVVAVVLAAEAATERLILIRSLDAHVAEQLRTDADAVATAMRRHPERLAPGREPLLRGGVGFAQVIDERGQVVMQTPLRDGGPALGSGELRRAQQGPLTLERPLVAGLDPPARLLARPLVLDGRRLVLVVGGSVSTRNAAVRGLEKILFIGGPLLLVLVSIAGYGLAVAALRPVASMRRNATAMAEEDGIRQLPLPAARDEIRRLGETLNRLLARVAQSVAREREFIADASHELRTPLAILTTELEVAAHPDRSPEELREFVESAADEVRMLTRISEDLLMLAQASADELPLQLETLDARRTLEDVAHAFRARAAEQGRSIGFEAPAGLWLHADGLRLRQALGNLVVNALNHGSGSVVLRGARNGDRIELSVEDSGPGLPPEFVDSAFERFARADRRRTGAGTGLGLPIVSAIARTHGGEAGIENRPEGGARAWIALPAAEAERLRGDPPGGLRETHRPARATPAAPRGVAS